MRLKPVTNIKFVDCIYQEIVDHVLIFVEIFYISVDTIYSFADVLGTFAITILSPAVKKLRFLVGYHSSTSSVIWYRKHVKENNYFKEFLSQK